MTTKITTLNTLSNEDMAKLEKAKQHMEQIGWAMQGLNKVGNVIESRINLLPKKQQEWLQKITYKVLHTVVKSNLLSMKAHKNDTKPWNKTYKALVTSSGMLGGALGATAFVADLSLTTKLMMRSIMDIARNEGEDLSTLDTQLACLQVFALGGTSKHDNSIETGYYASRIAISTTVKGSTAYAIEGVFAGSANPLMQLIGAVASRFSIQVSEKFVSQAVPLLGAAGGGAINLAFMNHFQRMAQAHFCIRRLERKYGDALVRTSYEAIEIGNP